MFRNYFKTAWQTIKKNKIYSSINILGLTVGLWACMMVATVVIDDLSYDRQWSRTNDLYRIISVNKMGDGLYDRFAASFAGLSTNLRTDYPEVEAVAEMSSSSVRLKLNGTTADGIKLSTLSADTAVWKLIDVTVVNGNPKTYTPGNKNLVITESYAKQFFPAQNPVGKIIYDVPAYGTKPDSYLITGVIKDLPSNTHLRADAIVLHKPRKESLNKQQYGTLSQSYVLMKPGTNMAKFSAKLNAWYRSFVEKKDKVYQFEFQPIKDVYLHSDFAAYQAVKGSYKNIYILSGVALLLLVIACVNFINLSTARAIQRVRETGVRKILGAGRAQLVFQFLTESLLFFVIAAFLATALYQVSLQPVQHYIGHPLAQTFISRAYLFVAAYGIILLISLLTGIYPAWLMSGFKPAATLKGKLFSASSSYAQNWVRKSLVVLQFSISLIVLIALFIVQQQVNFMKTKDIGFDKNNLLGIASVSWDGKGKAFKNELLKQPAVLNASVSSWMPTQGPGYMSKEVENPTHTGRKIKVWFITADLDFAKTIGLKLKSGRLLGENYGADAGNNGLETIDADSMMSLDMAKYEEAAGRQHSMITAYTAKLLQINTLNQTLPKGNTTPVGIIEDFHNESLKDAMEPTFITAESAPQYGGMLIRIKPGSEKQALASVQKLWKQFYPDKLLDLNWVDEQLNKQYETESRLQQLFTFFSGLSMFLAALGVFGLIVQATGQRLKEIGVRKVLGASVLSIVRLFSSDFLRLVMIAIVLASPLAWWAMNKWLQDFAYRTTISWWIFFAAGGIAILIALLTVSIQSVKAAMANPVESLRSE